MTDRLIRISVKRNASEEDYLEACRRSYWDGIPRTVYADGRIMKWDWQAPLGVVADDGTSLEDHVTRLLEAENGQQG